MKISYSWLKEYLPLDVSADELATLLTGLGLEVSSVDHIESVRGGLKGVVAGKVLTCEKHPNADRLSLTTVDIGAGTPLQIVCGAPNVAMDQKVWVATVGTFLYPAGTEEALKISRAKVRGETSEGMICAEDELGLGDDHAGILILPDDVVVGTKASDYYHITSDDVIEVELTPNRSDAICHIGVARDLAAWFAVHGGGAALTLPPVPSEMKVEAQLRIPVEVRNTDACPRYCSLTLTGVTVGDSPEWLQNRLRMIGVKPINNVVDATNFVLHEMGQPLHAFDADKITGGKVIVQTLPDGTKFTTLDGEERTLTAHDLMICDGEGRGMCIGGVYGGIGTGITAQSTNIFLESAHFNPQWIRRTSMHHDLRTDAARTFEKTTDPNICRNALMRVASLILQMGGGKVASEISDIYPVHVPQAEVRVRYDMIKQIIGIEIPSDQLRSILAALHMEIIGEDDEGVVVKVPTNKADVTREADVIEEILRIYGYDNVPMPARLEISLNPPSQGSASTLRQDVGNFLTAQGFIEIMGLSLVESRQFDEGPLKITAEERILIENTSNIHLDLMRHNLLASAMETVRFNQNRMQTDLLLYEFGRTYVRIKDVITESERLSLSLTGNPGGTGWKEGGGPVDFFTLKKAVHQVLVHLGITIPPAVQATSPQWAYGLQYLSEGREICAFGRVSERLCKQFDLRQPLFYADFDVRTLIALSSAQQVRVAEISRFPAVHRDIALVLGSDITYQVLEEIISRAGGTLLADHNLFDVYENAQTLGPGKRSLAIALTFQHPARTLTDDEVSKAVGEIVSALERKTGAVLR